VTHEQIERLYPGGRWTRPDHYETRCPLPAHEHGDRNPGLGFTWAADGRVLVKCMKGCDTGDVLAAKGLKMADLAPPSLNGQYPSGREPEAVYVYRTAAGEAACEKVRLPGKQFKFRLPSSLEWGLKGLEPPLYNLHRLAQSKPGELIGVCEGEKDAERLGKAGLVATCNPHGASAPGQKTKWKQQYTDWLKKHLADRKFLIFADQDAAGLDHAESVYESLAAAGLSVRAAEMPGIRTGEDVSDWLGRHSEAEFQALIEDPVHPLDARVYTGPELMAADIPEPEWLVPGFIARRVMTMLVGIGKLGKSVLAHQLCVAGATGGVWLDQPVPLVQALYVNWEDPLGLTRARAVQQFQTADLPAAYRAMDPPWGTAFPQFLDWLAGYLPRHGIELVVIDPLGIAARWKDERDNAETGPTLRNIQEVAQVTGAAILVVHHTRKQPGEAGLEVRGAGAIFSGIQGFLSFKRRGPGEYQLDTLDKMPGEHGGDKSFVLRREPHTLTWHITEHLQPQEQEKQANVQELREAVIADPGISVPELALLLDLSVASVRRYAKEEIEAGRLYESTRLRRPEDAREGRPPKGLFFRPDPSLE
jgi:hypothetical protein